jgi:hypothetical protein
MASDALAIEMRKQMQRHTHGIPRSKCYCDVFEMTFRTTDRWN